MKYIKSYTVILLMPYLYENGTAEAWQKLMEELGPMGYSVQDEESLELQSSLTSEVRIILIMSLSVLLNKFYMARKVKYNFIAIQSLLFGWMSDVKCKINIMHTEGDMLEYLESAMTMKVKQMYILT